MTKDPTTLSKTQLDKDIEDAMKAQKARLAAPSVNVTGALPIQLKELEALYAPDCAPKTVWENNKSRIIEPEYHAYWEEKKKYRECISKGYQPVLKPDRSVVEFEGVVLFKIPYDLWKKYEENPKLRAKRRVSGLKAADVADPETGEGGYSSSDAVGVVEEGTSIMDIPLPK